ncbi:MAG: M3 family metallopeptidase, partial [Candidatus Hodarchaeales archaeon]
IDSLNWDITPEELEETIDKVIASAKSRIKEIIALEESSRTFENTVLAYENIEADIEDDTLYLQFLSHVSTDKNVRNASAKARVTIEKYKIERRMDVELYTVLKTVYRDSQRLSAEDKRLFDRVLRDFRRNGLDLEPEKQARIREIRKEIADLRVQFGQTLNNWSEKVIFSPEELEGVPENTMGILEKDSNGNYAVGMSYPEVYPILEYAVNPDSRLKILKEFLRRGGKENLVRMEKVLKLRDEAAKLLGYPDHASYIHEIRMAGNPENVRKFLSDLEEKLKVKARDELKELIELKDEILGEKSDGIILQHDWLYYVRMNREKKYKVDKEEVKKYFLSRDAGVNIHAD